jgi:hypothetical protein
METFLASRWTEKNSVEELTLWQGARPGREASHRMSTFRHAMPVILGPHMDHADDEVSETDERRDHEDLRRAAR